MTTPAPVPVAASPTAKSKDPKKVAAGRAGAAARKAKQESLLEELRAAKQSLQPEAVAETATPVADVVVAKQQEQPVADVPSQQPMPAPGDPGDPVKADWTPWILLVGAGLAALCVWRSPLVKLTERQQKQQHPEARSSGATLARQPPATPRCAQHLKVPDDPFYMAWCAIMSSTPTQKNIVNDLYQADVVVAKQQEQPVADVPSQQPMPAAGDPGDPVKADWTPWILLVGAGLAALCVWRSPLVKLTERQQKQQHPEARSSGATLARQPPATPRCAQHLKVPDDPFYMAWCAIMSYTPTQKNIVNDLYQAAVVGGLAIGYAKLGQMVFKGPLPRLDLTPRDAGMAILDLSAAMATKDMLIKQGLIPSDIVK